ncbi:hypothetical protein T439DRAFT_376022 [Meredithblackwellia eburnea MCA 4105]
MASSGGDNQPQRPFACQECGSRYTRQEHLDRHVTAKHRESKEFVCSYCQKGFARRDILRRHELAHAKNDKAPPPDPPKPAQSTSSSRAKSKRAPPTEAPQAAPPIPTKVMRISRACTRCAKSKLRCDGEERCSRCIKQDVECTYDRAWGGPSSLSVSFSNQPSNLPSSSSSQTDSPSNATGESGEEDPGHPPDWDSNQQQGAPPQPPPSAVAPQPPTPGTVQAATYGVANSYTQPPRGSYGPGTPVPGDPWSRPMVPMNLPGISPYAVPMRDTQLNSNVSMHQHSAFPPSNFQHSPGPFAFGYGRNQAMPSSSYGVSTPFPPASIPLLRAQSRVNSRTGSRVGSRAQSPAAGGRTSPQHPLALNMTSAWDVGRPSSSSDAQQGQGLDFLDLVARGGSSMETELDWHLLNTEPGFSARLADGGTGFTPREGNSPGPNLDSALDEAHLLGPSLNIEASEDPVNPSPGDFFATLSALPAHLNEDDGLNVQDSAAESLLRLASHTPRESPEPEAENEPSDPEKDEKPRSSHTSHSPSDPWPLSYRPGDDAGPSGRSRGPTPLPDVEEVPSLVPRVTEETRVFVLQHVRDIAAPSLDHSERFVPQYELLDLFVQLFFSRYQILLPLVHAPTFDPNDRGTCPPFLLLAVAAIGARYAWDLVKGAATYAYALTETSRRLLQIATDTDNTMMNTVGWQQANILLLHAGLVSGPKRDLERSQALAGMPFTFCRRQGWLKAQNVDESVEGAITLEDRWRRWRDREEIKRLGFATILLGGLGNLFWDFEPTSLYIEASRTYLPCSNQLWEAPSATAWQALFKGSVLPPRGTDTLTAIKQVTDRSLHSSDSSLLVDQPQLSFSMTAVLIILHVLAASKLHEMHSTTLFLPEALQFDNLSPVRDLVEAGIEFFQDRVLLPPELQESEGNPPANSMALMLHLTSISQRLPLRILQAVARASSSTTTQDADTWVQSWAAEDGGRVARTTAWHAGQLIGIVRTICDTPLEPFALTYAGLALLCFCTAQVGMPPFQPPPPPRHGDIMEEEGGLGENGGDVTGTEVRLDRLVERTDEDLVRWIATGRGIVTLDGVGTLEDVQAGEKVLRLCGERLSALKVWKVGELLGGTLTQLAEQAIVVKSEPM